MKKVDPASLTLKDLQRLATDILKPEEGETVVIGIMARDAIEEVEKVEDPVEPDPKVVQLFPNDWTPSEYQKERQAETIKVLEQILYDVNLGKFRDFVIVLGDEKNEERLYNTICVFSSGVVHDALVFLGGIEIAKQHIFGEINNVQQAWGEGEDYED